MAHAILSASGAHRWLNCPPSARLEEAFPDTTSEAAKEGTLAHELAELMMAFNLQRVDEVTYTGKLEAIRSAALYQPEMERHCEAFTLFIAENKTPDALVFLEERVTFTQYVPDGFGTCDVIILSEDGTLHVIDFKYGKRVVEATKNPQVMLYALGALGVYDALLHIERVKMTIYQPRRDHVDTYEMLPADLYTWGEQKVKKIAAEAFEGKGEFQVGEHCFFCRARNTCRKRAEENLKLAQYEFAPPDTLSNDEIADILLLGKDIAGWMKDVENYALDKAVNHRESFKGFKVVEGRSNRTYVDEEAVEKALREKRFRVKDIYERKLLTVGKMEKLIGKEAFEEILEKSGLVIKPQGKPTLVPETDTRSEFNSAEIDFGGKYDEK